ncbi:hypothetical protein FE257_002819 [Aspergillus nanangensis]|uniref:BZIP domain-containing protein n=1 Tax=Aspergillus nanangensis TaxID=2582783 RepID=A0AAD4GPV2_ASPNN|nr:hypothetical protein FE257_002819 [Aspergillus nanangensis]
MQPAKNQPIQSKAAQYQRRYRERVNARVRLLKSSSERLEARIRDLEARNQHLDAQNHALREEIDALREEIDALREETNALRSAIEAVPRGGGTQQMEEAQETEKTKQPETGSERQTTDTIWMSGRPPQITQETHQARYEGTVATFAQQQWPVPPICLDQTDPQCGVYIYLCESL